MVWGGHVQQGAGGDSDGEEAGQRAVTKEVKDWTGEQETGRKI